MDFQNINFILFMDILKKNKGVIALFTFVCVAAVSFFSFISPDIYRATSVLLIGMQSEKVLDMQDVVTLGADYYAYNDYLNTQIEILQSRPIAETVFRECVLTKGEVQKPDSFVQRMKKLLKDFKKRIKEYLHLSDQSLTQEEKYLMELEAFRKIIKIDHQRDTQLVSISYEHKDPELAAAIVNALAKAYMDSNLEKKIAGSREALSWLTLESQKMKKVLNEKEIELQKFRSENNIISVEERREILNNTILDLSRKITEAESIHSEYTSRYREKNPKMKQITALLADLRKMLAEKRSEAIENEKKFITYNELSQDIKISQTMLENILQREKETVMTSSLNSNNVSLIEGSVVPYEPVKPKRILNIFLSLIVGLLGGSAWAYVLEFFIMHIRSEKDIAPFNLNFLGYIPFITRQEKNKHFQDSFLLFNNKGIISELFNNLRTSVLLNAELDKKTVKGKSIVITSFLPSEGKTLITCNLGVALAKYRFKVIVVEADLRKPRIKEIFCIRKKEGLSDLLAEGTPLDELVFHTSDPLLDVLHAGRIPENPSELLGSNAFKNMVEQLEQKYEIILIDTPPVFSVTDPIILSSIVKKTVVVSKHNSTPKHLVPVLKRKLELAQSKIIGVIINQVHNMESKSSYADYYGHNYYSADVKK